MHFTVLVIVPDPEEKIQTRKQLVFAVNEMLLPYSEHNPAFQDNAEYWGEWDWYLIGGRWTGFFEVEEGQGFIGEPGVMTYEAETDLCRADAVRNKYLVGEIPITADALTKAGWVCFNDTYFGEDFNTDLFFKLICEAHPNDWFVLVDCHT